VADYTILETGTSNNWSQIVIVFPIAVTNNSVGVAWQEIVAELRTYRGEIDTTMNPRRTGAASTAYRGNLDDGEIVELSERGDYDANAPIAEKLAVLDAVADAAVADYTVDFENRFNLYGLDRST
jgi:hypothetical protein